MNVIININVKNTALLTVLLAINFCSTAQNSLLSKDKITLNGGDIPNSDIQQKNYSLAQ